MIETERLILRPFEESDAADVLEYREVSEQVRLWRLALIEMKSWQDSLITSTR